MKRTLIKYTHFRALLLLAGLAAFAILSLNAQTKRYAVVFYNVENVFDTVKSPGVFDQDFTPEGSYAWNGTKYWKKMANLEQVFGDISVATGGYPVVIGVSEIENRSVLEDISSLPRLQKANYQIVHYDSPDARGVDVGMLYRPDKFVLEGSMAIPLILPWDSTFRSRDILVAWGTIEKEPFCFMVNHWPSRRGGETASAPRRNRAAQLVREAVDSIAALRPATKFVIMGDMNDDPNNESLAKYLGGKLKASEVGKGDLFNPFYEMHKKGLGTLAYQDRWNLFDNMIVSQTLLHAPPGEFRLVKGSGNKYWGQIFIRPYLTQTSGQYKGYPFRSFSGTNFQNGYSDHFPVYIYIAK